MRNSPIDGILPKLKTVFQQRHNLVLVAPPGAGKTTRVPLALLDETWLQGRKILMLEPRRLAARGAATYMASLLGEQAGQTVGYRVRFDKCVGSQTVIEVITEGILIRMLQHDPALTGIGLVIFDEFHERSLAADLGLALCQQAQILLRDDLRILVMSATLVAAPVAALLGEAPLLVSEGRMFSIETHYLDRPIALGSFVYSVTAAIMKALHDDEGDILVFLPGVGEIRQIRSALLGHHLGDDVRVTPLYGVLSQAEQNLAILPDRTGVRKIILATSIAETSLTVEGVSVVIDCGLMRVPRFSPRTGMTRLDTIRVSRSSADQRRGRAGRLGPGVCYRLWTRLEDQYLCAETAPEILTADLTGLVLELAVWGTKPIELAWLDVPPEAATNQAVQLLQQLGALDQLGRVTSHGRRMADAGIHPRLAHMIVKGNLLGRGELACQLAAVLTVRGGDADLTNRIEALRSRQLEKLDAAVWRNVKQEATYLMQQFGISAGNQDDSNACGLLLAFAYPDRIAKRRSDGRYLLRNGRGAILLAAHAYTDEYLSVAELDDAGADSRIFTAAPVSEVDLYSYFANEIETINCVEWHEPSQAVRARCREQLGSLVLSEKNLLVPDQEDVLAALLAGIRHSGLTILPWTKAAQQLRLRMAFMHEYAGEGQVWPDVSDEALLASLGEWLGPFVYGLTSRDDLKRLNIVEVFKSKLSWQQSRELDDYAPTHVVVPSGQRVPINYSNPALPVLAVRLQQMFGQIDTPCIFRGQVPLTIQLLSPAQRPVQVTRDLASFWRTAYFEVKKDLMGRYPKHYWPDNPLLAQPTHRVRSHD